MRSMSWSGTKKFEATASRRIISCWKSGSPLQYSASPSVNQSGSTKSVGRRWSRSTRDSLLNVNTCTSSCRMTRWKRCRSPSAGITTRPFRNSKKPPTPSGMKPGVTFVCLKCRLDA